MKEIDLRSDTVTKPTPAMRESMATADVGDDVYGEDPTVNKLQEMAAKLLGLEAGLFVSSGTMGNLVAVLAHCQRGDEVILGNKSHTFLFEAGGISALGSIHSCQLPNQPDGSILLEDIRSSIRPSDAHQPITRLVSLENTHNRCGGSVLSKEYILAVADFCNANQIFLHLDGARIFNAAAALNIPVAEITSPFDSVTFCLSKGLCAPVGSVICGSRQFINKAHRIRKMLGGGMRQAGILAAAGIVALETMVDRISQDHDRAKMLAQGLESIPGIIMDPGTPLTNMIFFTLDNSVSISPVELVNKMATDGIKISNLTNSRRFRLVTHYWIDDEAVDKTLLNFNRLLG